jgi:hypothetical protein
MVYRELTRDIFRIRIRQTSCSITVTTKPLVIAIVLLTIPAGGNIGVNIRAV